MKIIHESDGVEHECTLPYDGCVWVETPAACGCGAFPSRIRSDGYDTGHDFVRGAAYCFDCKLERGHLRVEFSTVFGLEEDDRVINHSRCKVY
jgi:hypothetical protein